MVGVGICSAQCCEVRFFGGDEVKEVSKLETVLESAFTAFHPQKI